MAAAHLRLLVGFVLVATGCGDSFSSDSESPATGGSSSGGSGSGTGSMSGASGVGGAPTSCPPKPMEGSDCTGHDGLACSYGTDPRPSCRARYQCNAGGWQLVQPVESSKCNAFGTCPPTIATGVCTTLNTICKYESDGVFCRCSSIGPATQWRCSTPPGTPCPPLLPNEGDDCTQAISCNYGACVLDDAVTAECDGSSWSWAGNGGC